MRATVDPVPLRVAQWATGNIGARSLRAVIEHPDLDLAAVHVHSVDKRGVDASDLAGLTTPTGIVATGSIEEICALRPDCVLYMPRACDFDEVAQLLHAGINVVTTRGEFHRPASLDPRRQDQIEAACEQGGASVHSTGSSPGFITEAVPIVLTSIQRRLDSLLIDEFADLSQRDSPGLLFEVMGFGRPLGPADGGRAAHLRAAFGPSLEMLADAIGLPLDDVEADTEVAAAREHTTIAAGEIDAGTVAGQRTTVTGCHGGRPLLTFRATWYCTRALDADWELGATGWRLAVDGDAPLDVEMRLAVPLADMGATSPGYTAHRAVNAVPIVCAARPGIRTTADLPQIIARLGSEPPSGRVS
ncbi:MAG: dihydrodipicolinate reductase [Acidimicrobiia bacterium]|nr:dihydrodipicolinate reductase [Acidimicrobiia bacterium]